jgi:outer membrane protein assembly factor BamB
MATPPDLDHRLRASAGSEPDTERALADVMRRVRRRTRRRVAAAAATVAVAGGLVAAWVVEWQGSDEPSVFTGQPTTTTSQPGDAAGRLRQVWTAPDVGMSGAFAPQGGQLVVPAGETVFTANGFGVGQDLGDAGFGPGGVGRITALDRETGSVRWTAEFGEEAWLQGVAGDIVVANTQHERIVGLDAATGAVRWEILLSELDLDGYGAVRSAVAAPRSAIGLSANTEGDVRPPVILGINTATGDVAWTTPLAEGTDLTWGTPPVRDGETVFLSTLSHPGSAPERVVHLVEFADGSVRWTVGLGGGQGSGFSEASATINGPYVHLPAFPDVVTVDRGDGRRLWAHPGWMFATTGDGVWTVAGEGRLALLDAGTAAVGREVDSPVGQPEQLLDLGEGRIGVVDHDQFAALDANGEVEVLYTWPHPLVEFARWDRGQLLVATEDQAVTAYEVETS